MKTIKLSLFILPLAAVSFASCSECSICTKDDSPEVRICEEDYENEQEYHNAIGFMEFGGYDCDESL